jgi:hypothetical protein
MRVNRRFDAQVSSAAGTLVSFVVVVDAVVVVPAAAFVIVLIFLYRVCALG